MTKRILAMLMATVLILNALPWTVFAEELSENTATRQPFSTTEDISPRVIISRLMQIPISNLKAFPQAVGAMTISPFLRLMYVRSKTLNSLA